MLNFTFGWIFFKLVCIQVRYKFWNMFEFRPGPINFGVTNSPLSNSIMWAATWQNQQTDRRPAKTQISLGIRPVWSVIAVSLMCSLGPKLSSCGQQRLWSDWADAQADLSLRWAQTHFVDFVMSQLMFWTRQLLQFWFSLCLALGYKARKRVGCT